MGSLFPDQISNLCPLQRKLHVLSAGPPGKPFEPSIEGCVGAVDQSGDGEVRQADGRALAKVTGV